MDIKNVVEMAQNYFEKGTALKNYKVIGVIPDNSSAFSEDNYLYRVLAKYVGENEYKANTYAVWTSFNTSTNSMNYGHYDMSYKDAYELFATGKIEPNVGVSTERLVELGKTLADEIDSETGDPEGSYQLFKRLGLTEEELELFGIRKPKRYKQVEYEATIKIPVIVPQGEDEDCFPIDKYVAYEVSSNGINSYYLRTKVLRENLTSDQAKREDEYYGSDEID